MPDHSATRVISGLSRESALSICLKAFELLEWKLEGAAGYVLEGYTKQTWNRYANQITVEVSDQEIRVTSKMIHGEIADVFGRAKKDVADFLQAFEQCRENYQPDETGEISETIRQLEEETVQKAEQEVKLAVETEKVMRLGSVSPVITYLLIAINLIIFIAMVVSGADIMNPDADTIVQWGGNIADLTTQGEGWRLISSLFIHIGILHLVFNMYGLYFIGQLLEPMLGKPLFITAYLFSGVIASLISLWWHQDQVMVSAGASGAIFGLFGLFLFLLLTNLIPREIRDALLKSVGIFVGYNLIMGMRGGVDNAAHIGGLLGGIVAGVICYYFVLKNQVTDHTRKWIVAASLLISAGLIAVATMKEISGTGSYISKTAEEKFNEVVGEFTVLEKEALDVYERSNTLTKEEYIQQLRTITLANWKKGESLFRELGTVQLNERLAAIQAEMVNYCRLNQEKASLTIRIFSELSQEYNEALNQKEEEIGRSVLKVQYLSGVDTTQ